MGKLEPANTIIGDFQRLQAAVADLLRVVADALDPRTAKDKDAPSV